MKVNGNDWQQNSAYGYMCGKFQIRRTGKRQWQLFEHKEPMPEPPVSKAAQMEWFQGGKPIGMPSSTVRRIMQSITNLIDQ